MSELGIWKFKRQFGGSVALVIVRAWNLERARALAIEFGKKDGELSTEWLEIAVPELCSEEEGVLGWAEA